MRKYLQLLEEVLTKGEERTDRTNVGTLSLFGKQLRFNIHSYFPLFTTRKISFKTICYETLWFLRGESNTKFLTDNGIKIWNNWAKNGGVGPLYGVQWRNFNGIDQIANLQLNLKVNPHSRRHIISAWNPSYLPYEHLSPQENVQLGKMALAPCHTLFQFYVRDNKLDCQLYIRSNDLFIGMPHNVAGYSLLTYMLAYLTNLEPGELIYTIGDAHIYSNHIEQVETLLQRKPLKCPKLKIVKQATDIDDFTYEHFELINYKYHPKLSGDLAV